MHTRILIHFPLKLWNIFHQLKQNKTKLQQVVFKLDNITVHGILMKPILGVPRLQLNNVQMVPARTIRYNSVNKIDTYAWGSCTVSPI